MEIYAPKFFYFHICYFFLFSNMILSDALIYPYRSFKHSKWWRQKL